MQRKSLLPKILTIFFLGAVIVSAETMTSDKYQILNPSINAGGDITESNNFSLLAAIGDPASIAKLESSNYKITEGIPSSFEANAPLINCFETTSTDTDTICSTNTEGMQAICGAPGCYDKARIEIDTQNNPYDTLYLVKLTDTDSGQVYYLQSDHSISPSFDINDFLDQCSIEGIDPEEPNCNTGGAREDTSLQKTNIFGLSPNTSYEATVSALHGDFTQTQFSTGETASTTDISLILDIDISPTDIETSSPYEVDLGNISSIETTTAASFIWVDVSTNYEKGIGLYSSDENSGLHEPISNTTILSSNEDLDNITNTDGGYGLKILNSSQSSLGPLKSASSIYQTAQSNEVGQLSNSSNLIFYTDTNSSYGQITEGRGQIAVKAKSAENNPSGEYTDAINFYCTTNL